MQKHFMISEGRVVPAEGQAGPVILYVNPDETERRYLIEELKLDEHTLFSAMDPDELSRLEFEPAHIAIIFKRPKNYSAQDQFLFKVISMGAFLFADRLVIVMAEDAPLFDGREFARIVSLSNLTLKLLSRSIIHFREHLRVISMISDDLQNKINTAMENSHLLNMFRVEKSLEYYLNSINSNGLLVDKLKFHAARIGFTTEELELLEDILIENSQCAKQAEIYSNILASLMDARASIVSNNLNVLMKTLTIITIAIMVPTFIVSAFSMNVDFPLRNSPHAFWLIMSMAFSSMLTIVLVWRFKGW